MRALLVAIAIGVFVLTPGRALTAQSEPVDINSASAEELTKVPGMTEGLAIMIMGGRPYQNIEELVSRQILTKEQFDKMKDGLAAKAGQKKK